MFPSNPIINDQHTEHGKGFIFNGEGWVLQSNLVLPDDSKWVNSGSNKIIPKNSKKIPSSIIDGLPLFGDIVTRNADEFATAEQGNLADIAASNANDAAALANTKAGLANDAAILANSKAGLADSAATNANNKAALANTATTNANDAAALATEAAETANNAKGWTPTTAFETYGTKQLKKLTGYIGGTGDAPTDNIGLYFAEGGFTANKDLATDFRGTDGVDGVDGETVVNVNASSTILQAKVWIGTRAQYDAQAPLADDVLIFIIQ